jgi:hypothetical protein
VALGWLTLSKMRTRMPPPGNRYLSASLVPLSIRHAELDLSWPVVAVVEDWTTLAYHDDVLSAQAPEAAGSRMSTQQAVNYAAADGAGLLAGK